MRFLVATSLLATIAAAASAAPPVVFQATDADKASGFRDMADCQRALGTPSRKSRVSESVRGAAFKRALGNVSRCEKLTGEFLITVGPVGSRAALTHRPRPSMSHASHHDPG